MGRKVGSRGVTLLSPTALRRILRCLRNSCRILVCWSDGSSAAILALDDALGFISAMIDLLEVRYAADPARIYCTGFSNGASMTFSVGLNLSNRIAAIAPVSGQFWYKGKTTRVSRAVALHHRQCRSAQSDRRRQREAPVGRDAISSTNRGSAQGMGTDARLRASKCRPRAVTVCWRSLTTTAPRAARSSTGV